METIKLYEILDAEEFIKNIENIEDFEEEELEKYSKALKIQEKNKVNAIGGYLRETELVAENAKNEAKRILEIAKFYENRAKRIKQSIQWAMESREIEKIETDRFRISFRKSESVVVDNAILDKKFQKIIVTPDKIAIKKAIKNGEEVIGAKIITNKNLSIK